MIRTKLIACWSRVEECTEGSISIWNSNFILILWVDREEGGVDTTNQHTISTNMYLGLNLPFEGRENGTCIVQLYCISQGA